MEDYHTLYPRHLARPILEMLGSFPVVALLGARQVGKSTLVELFFWRTHAGDEVDFLLSRGGQLAGVEVKQARTIRGEDLRGLRTARELLGRRLGVSVVLHPGTRAFVPEPGIAVVPLGTFLAGR